MWDEVMATRLMTILSTAEGRKVARLRSIFDQWWQTNSMPELKDRKWLDANAAHVRLKWNDDWELVVARPWALSGKGLAPDHETGCFMFLAALMFQQQRAEKEKCAPEEIQLQRTCPECSRRFLETNTNGSSIMCSMKCKNRRKNASRPPRRKKSDV
ncbi:MAG: hypothetical protein AAF581_10960 [Planctomycetota bacterium]